MSLKNYLFLLVLIFFGGKCTSLKNTNSGTFKDKRDGKIYSWIRLKSGKIWMAQNLNYQYISSSCYQQEEANCVKYGRLYNWESANKVCPKGWRLPTDKEWWEMASF